jgi:hypothetical protein
MSRTMTKEEVTKRRNEALEKADLLFITEGPDCSAYRNAVEELLRHEAHLRTWDK